MENAFWVGVVGVLGGLGPARASRRNKKGLLPRFLFELKYEY